MVKVFISNVRSSVQILAKSYLKLLCHLSGVVQSARPGWAGVSKCEWVRLQG